MYNTPTYTYFHIGIIVFREGVRVNKQRPGRNLRPQLPIGENAVDEETLAEIIRSLRQIRYGTITITVQDAKVVQIDKTEKVRLT